MGLMDNKIKETATLNKIIWDKFINNTIMTKFQVLISSK